jgi:hypothetical protein
MQLGCISAFQLNWIEIQRTSAHFRCAIQYIRCAIQCIRCTIQYIIVQHGAIFSVLNFFALHCVEHLDS